MTTSDEKKVVNCFVDANQAIIYEKDKKKFGGTSRSQVKLVLRLPVEDSISSCCGRHLLRLAGVKDTELAIQRGEELSGDELLLFKDEEKKDQRSLATRLSELVGWVAAHVTSLSPSSSLPPDAVATASAPSQQVNDILLLCGDNVADRRKVTRGIKRVISWIGDWSDLETPPEEQMSSALNKQIIFDKFIRRRNLKYIVDSSVQERKSGRGFFFSMADIVLCCIVCQWLNAFSTYEMYLLAAIPSVIVYIQGIRRDIQELHTKHGMSSTQIDKYLCKLDSWVMRAQQLNHKSSPFRFKSLKVKGTTKTSLNNAPMQAPILQQGKVEEMIDVLLSTVDWSSGTLIGNNESPSNDSASRVTPACHNQISKEIYRNSNELFWDLIELPCKRSVRKQAQILSLLSYASQLLPIGGTAVEFCSGGGYVGIALAAYRPDANIILTDMNSISLAFAKERISRLRLSNVAIIRCELSDWESMNQQVPEFQFKRPEFHLGLALHACGAATDIVSQICITAKASFILSPCCYGFIQHAAQQAALPVHADHDEPAIDPLVHCLQSTSLESNAITALPRKYPLSDTFRSTGWEASMYAHLCKLADHTFWGHDDRAATFNSSGRRAMRFIDTDRLLYYRSCGYLASVHFMQPKEASPKNHVLVCQVSQ